MSAVIDHTRDERVAALLAQHGGDHEAALLACLLTIDRLADDYARVSYATSRGYAYGKTRRTAPVEASVPEKAAEVLDV